jgi:hypothetical protein
MSSPELKKMIKDHILPALAGAAGSEKDPGSARNQVVRHVNGQLFVVEQKILFDGLDKISDYVGVKKLTKAAKTGIYLKYLKYLSQTETATSSKKVDPEKMDILKAHRREIRKKNLLGISGTYSIFIVAKYENMKSKKREILRTALLKEYKDLPDKQEELKKAFSYRGKPGEAGLGWDLGHGEHGDPSSAVGITRTQKAAADSGIKLPAKDRPKLQKLFSSYEDTVEIKINHEQMFDDKGNFKKEYVTIISLQDLELNKKDAKDIESKARRAFKAEAERLLESPSSFRMREALERVILSSLTKDLTKLKNVKYKGVKPRRKIKEKARAVASKKRKHKDRLSLIRDTGVTLSIAKSIKKDSKKGKGKGKTRAATASRGRIGSPMQARNMFNATLSEAVRENMGGAALHNVSGRFADSVHVHQVMPHKGTSGVVQYSYMYNPYKVFEGHETRDPRLLIDQTIREQAAEMALGKFTTQRL